jgi:ABC-2 type transport system permease protein
MRVLSKRNKSILSEMVRTDFKLRYQGSVLGYLWSLLKPLMMSATLYFVFAKVFGLGNEIPHYGSYLLLGIMCWTFFTEVTSGGVGAVVAKGDLIRKISIPRYLTVVSSSVSALINFSLNFVVLGIIMTATGVDIYWRYVILVPLLMLELYIFALALAFILSAAFVKFRDVSFIWEVFMQMLFYMVPILYKVSFLTDKYAWGKWFLINPVAQVIQDMRYILVTNTQPTAWSVLGTKAIGSVMFISGLSVFAVWYFRREAKHFAENV